MSAQGIAARSDETHSGSAEGKSPVRKDAPKRPLLQRIYRSIGRYFLSLAEDKE